MGAVTFSLDPLLLDCLKTVLSLDVFVETGTFEGATTELAAGSFAEVHSIELSRDYYERASARLARFPRVHLHRGESPAVLTQLRPRLAGQGILYWLDAHWCDASDTAGAEAQCPLHDELAAIGQLGENSVVLIDDARLFLCPPRGTHRSEHWPSFDSLARQLLSLGSDRELLVLNDVICLIPSKASAAVRQLALQHGFDWLEAAAKSRGYDEMLRQMGEKEALISHLHTEAERLRQELIAETMQLRELKAHLEVTLHKPLRLAKLCAMATWGAIRQRRSA
jgi:hypothetical protein